MVVPCNLQIDRLPLNLDQAKRGIWTPAFWFRGFVHPLSGPLKARCQLFLFDARRPVN